MAAKTYATNMMLHESIEYYQVTLASDTIYEPSKVRLPKFVQLAAKESEFETFEEIGEDILRLRREYEIKQMEQEIENFHKNRELVQSLPTMSAKRKEKLQLAEVERKKKVLQEAKLRNKILGKRRPFKKRTGGPKYKRKVLKVIDPKVMAARRAARRKKAKLEKAQEEAKRQEEFIKNPPKTKETLVVVEYIEDNKQETIQKCCEEESDEDEETDEYDRRPFMQNIPEEPKRVLKPVEDVVDEDSEFAKHWLKSTNAPLKLLKASKRHKFKKIKTKKPKKTIINITTTLDFSRDDGSDVKWQKGCEEMRKFSKGVGIAKTRFCTSTLVGKECKHGDNCRFAHSVQDYTPKYCVFTAACKNVCIFG